MMRDLRSGGKWKEVLVVGGEDTQVLTSEIIARLLAIR